MDHLTALLVRGAAADAKYPRLIKAIKLIDEYDKWEPGKKLKILLVGYNGARNTGADVRVAAMVEQFYKILGPENIEITVMTLDEENVGVYFKPPTKLIKFSTIYFRDLLKACSSHHIAVLCEGSCLKSKFANALTLFFCEAAGIMKNQGKPCIAYGSEAGYMDPFVRKTAQKLCEGTYFIARTKPSLKIIEELGLKGHLGTDTAWTFPPHLLSSPSRGEELKEGVISGGEGWATNELREKCGWDGQRPLLGLAVINPFWWPVKPSIAKLIKSTITGDKNYHYQKWYFFNDSREGKKKFENYLDAIASAANNFVEKHNAQPVIIGMEALDYDPCVLLKKRLKSRAPVFSSKFYDGYQMSAILRSLTVLVTSRYHARVLSMGGGIPSIAVSMDERLYNLLEESGHLEDYYLETGDPHLKDKLELALDKILKNKDKVKDEILATLPNYLKMMDDMGEFFKNYLLEHFPGSRFGHCL